MIKDGTRVEKENTAHEHHYIKFHEVYYTKTDGVKNEADNYVCPECGACITEPVKSKYEQRIPHMRREKLSGMQQLKMKQRVIHMYRQMQNGVMITQQ